MAIGHRGRKVKGKVTRPQEITPLFLLPLGIYYVVVCTYLKIGGCYSIFFKVKPETTPKKGQFVEPWGSPLKFCFSRFGNHSQQNQLNHYF